MQVLRIFNNNVVLASTGEGGEVVVTGRGIGFQVKQGDEVDATRIAKVFYPADGRDPDHLAEMLSFIPAEHIKLIIDSMADAGMSQDNRDKLTLVIALADHVGGAIRRAHDGQILEVPLRAEVQQLYAEEYQQAHRLVEAINERISVPISLEEAVAFTLHLVNASFTSGDLSYTYKMTGLIEQMISVIAEGDEKQMDEISVARFITHLRYLFVRIAQHKQLTGEPTAVSDAVNKSYPEAVTCALRLAELVELRLGEPLTEDEISYLALHVARLRRD
ncbi:Cryptic beta-glucoside bgl operon antiterminator [Corynebacterium kalinowskii]|uniref:Cryptic beta-glucoside bgl operon antiterminator n=1 Tax=Corynebacterium kalinowskii TaxID=2675216 RepID=A0A6B8VNZ2_9CORY|nr:PRD domain-containing protein [Corynebacterium kalinowskii]QGU01267.1 Cryptic beta-glucoside bgl operon antiterminator [Corynebacterium kalinowskii]